MDQYKDQFNIFDKNVAFYYDDIIGTFNYGSGHPMKPFRVAMTHELVKSYNLLPKLSVYDKTPWLLKKLGQGYNAEFINLNKKSEGYIQDSLFTEKYMNTTYDEILTRFHSTDYIDLIKQVTPENKILFEDQLYRYNFGEDCPVMDRLYEYCGIYSSASLVGASLLGQNKVDITVNFAGGFHHAKQSEASGFCYVNDVNIAILELLQYYQRVLYVDIDIHHGDGVEEAFYTTDRVMTCSFHKFRDYFPGTGHIDDVGKERGLYHAVNFPLNQGIDDENFINIIKPVLSEIMDKFNPDAIVVQCGADSLSGDRLGCFNLSIKGHGECVRFLKSFRKPMLVIGGGGYTLRNVPRCWTYETAICVNEELPNEMPDNEYREYFSPEYKLHLPISNMENQNTKEYLESITNKILENLKRINNGGIQISAYQDRDQIKVDVGDLIDQIKEEKEEDGDKIKEEI